MHPKKVALVTGANKGIGFEIGRQLCREGFSVLIAARDEKKSSEAAAKLKSEGLDAHGIVLDVSNAKTVANAAKTIGERFGRLDVLVNNAGIGPEFVTHPKPSELKMDTLRETFETNFFGAFTVIQAMLPLLKKSPSARIVNQSSTLGSLGALSDASNPMYGINVMAYSASKSALNMLTVSFAKELAAEKISVNTVCPGWVKTEMGGEGAPRSVEQGAAIAVKLASMESPPTGKYLDDAGEIRW